MKYQEIIFEEKGSVAYLTLNRPDIRNAITGEIIIKEIEEVCKRVQENNDIGVMIVTGAGSAFSAGGNVKDMYHKHRKILLHDARKSPLKLQNSLQISFDWQSVCSLFHKEKDWRKSLNFRLPIRPCAIIPLNMKRL